MSDSADITPPAGAAESAIRKSRRNSDAIRALRDDLNEYHEVQKKHSSLLATINDAVFGRERDSTDSGISGRLSAVRKDVNDMQKAMIRAQVIGGIVYAVLTAVAVAVATQAF